MRLLCVKCIYRRIKIESFFSLHYQKKKKKKMQTNLMKYSKTAKNFTFIKPVKITSLAESSKFMIFSDASSG